MNSTNSSSNCDSIIPWWTSFSISIGIFVLGFVILLLKYLNNYVANKMKEEKRKRLALANRKSHLINSEFKLIARNKLRLDEKSEYKIGFQWNFYIYCEILTSKGTIIGKFLNIFQLSFQILSWAIYVYFTFSQVDRNYVNGDCYETNGKIIKWLDFIVNVYCAFHFFLRAVAANDFLRFWIRATTIIDIFVIPNILVTSFLPMRRQGLSCFRIYYLRDICEAISVSFGIFKVNSKFEMAKVLLYIISFWFIGGGLFHMVEGIGNFWTTPPVNQEVSFWSSNFMVLATISTIGFGDVNPITIFGRCVMMFYMVYGVTIFVMFLPDVIHTIRNMKYADKYVSKKNEKHIIVSGQFENFTIIAFLKAFKKRKFEKSVRKTEIVIMNKQLLDDNLLAYFKRFSHPVKYIMGNPNKRKDVERLHIRKAKLAVVLSAPFSNQVVEDDINNILTAISLKSQKSQNLRTIVQLHLYSNKVMLKMYPTWNKNGNDIILCLDELKLGLMAYNCLVPGISTLIINLMTLTKSQQVSQLWRKDYETGLKSLIYNVKFSDCFNGMTSMEVALIIYKLWDVCLLAVKYVGSSNTDYIFLNPMSNTYKIESDSMIAIVMARDEEAANKLLFYCSKCTPLNPSIICDCYMNTIENSSMGLRIPNVQFKSKHLNENIKTKSEFSLIDRNYENLEMKNDCKYDKTGSFHWAPEPIFDEICLNIEQVERRKLSDHILICLCGNGEGTIDFCNFMMPLRTRSLSDKNLRTIAILGNKKYFENGKWNNIKNFPMFLIINGSPLRARDLRLSGLFNCHSVVIFSGNDNSIEISDRNVIMCATLIRSMKKNYNLKIQMITEIRNDKIAYYFSTLNSQNYDCRVSVQHSEPFARGIIFTNSTLYSCIYSVYRNPDTFLFLRALLNGPYSDTIESMFGCGLGLLPQTSCHVNQVGSGIIIHLFSLSQPPFNSIYDLYDGTINYSALFEWALIEKQMICLGLYRMNFNRNRYVFTHPEKLTDIFVTDQVYCCTASDVIDNF